MVSKRKRVVGSKDRGKSLDMRWSASRPLEAVHRLVLYAAPPRGASAASMEAAGGRRRPPEAAGRHENGGTHLHHAAAEQQAAAQQARMNSGFMSLLTDLGTVDFSWMMYCFFMFV